ncbi:hypothetical protein ASPFODRAFT_48394 [Aspergillus luchuensis CBS 106.47]|uniref:Uncharacterized protein n=1 Tax=Aspergillus luchuensis (strain CBS 106.47) TaxID=1137211 RepID=A0A1M3TC97_ASPLC|nr:hypothetical protein ASPFODRAFT_48394 [Aspergillus luchuensis CBS 106.47]
MDYNNPAISLETTSHSYLTIANPQLRNPMLRCEHQPNSKQPPQVASTLQPSPNPGHSSHNTKLTHRA